MPIIARNFNDLLLPFSSDASSSESRAVLGKASQSARRRVAIQSPELSSRSIVREELAAKIHCCVAMTRNRRAT